MPATKLRGLTLLAAISAVSAQEWSAERLQEAAAGFQSESLFARLEQIGQLLEHSRQLHSALVMRIHGDHREYLLKIDQLLDDLAAERWQIREDAERALIEIGGRARSMIQQRKEQPAVLEQAFRCARILDALEAKGLEQENQELRLLRGLVATAIYLKADERLLRALRSALGHTDPSVVQGAIRAIGKLGGEDEVDPLLQMMQFKGGVHRLSAVSALARHTNGKAMAASKRLLTSGELSRAEQAAMLRVLHARKDDKAPQLLLELQQHQDPVLASLAKLQMDPVSEWPEVRCILADRERPHLEGRLLGLVGEAVHLGEALPGLPVVELFFGDCDTVEFPAHPAVGSELPRVFLNQGSLLAGEILAIEPQHLRLRSPWFGELQIARKDIQGLALDPQVDRLVGAASDHDRIRLRSGDFRDGNIRELRDGKLVFEGRDGTPAELPLAEIAGLMFPRPRASEADTTVYSRVDLVTGERLLGFLGAVSGSQLGLNLPAAGSATIAIDKVAKIDFSVGGGAMWGFTLIVDYADNRIVEVDDQGREVFVLEDALGPWDAECLDNGNLLITEYSVSRVREVDRQGNTVWTFEDLKSPYDADRLANGNTLIADTFGGRVIEVTPQGQIVWSYDKDLRPFDVDRLANGNTLIANALRDQVIEVSPEGEIVWQVNNLPGIHDADRLPNGNTLVTLRSKGLVQELDRDGKVVWELTGLSSPGDADRLPNGHTLVAENNRVREFDRRGNEIWSKPMSWAVEVNRY